MSMTETGSLVVGLYDFESVSEGSLPFRKGEVLTLIKMHEDGWWEGSNAEGKVGLFPFHYVELSADTDIQVPYRILEVIADFDDENETFNLKRGDKVTVLKPIDDDWVLGRVYTRAGSADRLKDRVVGKFNLICSQETGEIDEVAEAEENEYAERKQAEKQALAEESQKERQRIEEEEQRIAEEEAKRIEDAKQKEIELEEKRKLEAQIRREAEEKFEASRIIRDKKAMEEAKEMKRKQDEMEMKLEEEKQRLAAEMAKMQEEMAKFAEAAEAARQRAAKAESDLEAAKAEKERLKIVAENNKAKKESDEDATSRIRRRKDLMNDKYNASFSKFTDSNGFTAPPPRQAPQKKKPFAALAKFQKLGGGAEKCKRCEKPVPFGPLGVKACGSTWHKDCFQCGTCEKVLRAGEYSENRGYPYCKNCYSRGFGIKGFGFGGAVTGVFR